MQLISFVLNISSKIPELWIHFERNRQYFFFNFPESDFVTCSMLWMCQVHAMFGMLSNNNFYSIRVRCLLTEHLNGVRTTRPRLGKTGAVSKVRIVVSHEKINLHGRILLLCPSRAACRLHHHTRNSIHPVCFTSYTSGRAAVHCYERPRQEQTSLNAY